MSVSDKKVLSIAMFGQKHVLSREGGVEVVVRELATRMAARGNKITCYDRSANHVSNESLDMSSTYCGVRIIRVFTLNKKGLAAMTSSLFAALKVANSDADIVHIHAEGPAAMCLIPKVAKKKVIVTIHGLDWARAKWGGFATKYIKWGEKQAAKYADEIIVLSKSVQEYFKREYNRETVYIPNGVSRPSCAPVDLIQNKWGLTCDSYVLYLGRIVPEKGLRYLLDAWKEIYTDKKLVIVGGSSDTEDYMNELKKICSGIDSIIFTGFQQGRVLEELYSNAYIYCLPSDLEGMPLSLLEAMSYGNCCLVSDIAECVEVVEDKAQLFRHSDTEDLKVKLQELLNEPKKVAAYKAEAAEFICRKYNWDDVVDRTLSLYTNK